MCHWECIVLILVLEDGLSLNFFFFFRNLGLRGILGGSIILHLRTVASEQDQSRLEPRLATC